MNPTSSPPRVRVLHLVVGGDIGGAERLLVDMATRPRASGADHEVALITPNRALCNYFTSAGLTVHDRGPSRENPLAYLARSFGPRDVAWVAGLLRERAIHVLHTHTFGTHVLGTRAALRAKVPQLRTEHHVMHYFDASTSTFTRWAAARTDRFVAISDYVLGVLHATAPAVAARTSVIRNGVDTAYWSVPENVAPRGAIRFAIVCRLAAWKRVHLAIEAAALAGVDLTVIGDGEERGKLEALAKSRGARGVTFAGFHNDPRPLLAEHDATVSTSKDEPLGLSVLESLAMGKPVIAFAGGGIPEIVQDGETGYLVRDATPSAFAAALERASRDAAQLRAMGGRGRRFVVDHCSIERMCEGYARVYRELRREPADDAGVDA